MRWPVRMKNLSFRWQFCLCKNTGGMVRWLKKSSKEIVSREVVCIRNWDGSHSKWLQIDHVFFAEMAHFFRLKNRDGSKFEQIYSSNSISLLILSHLGFFPLKKWAISMINHVIDNFSHFEGEPSQFLMDMTSRETCLLRWLFEPSHHTPHIPCWKSQSYMRISPITYRL